MLLRGGEDRLTECNGFQIIPTANLRLLLVFQSTQQLGHGADEGVGKPDFLPARLEPVAGLLFRREVQCARRSGRVTWPTDGTARQAFGPLDTPAEVDIALGTFPRRPGPDVI